MNKSQPIPLRLIVVALLLQVESSAYAVCKSTEYGAASTTIAATTPSSRFDVHGDGTVTDKKTGLMWAQCSQGQTASASSCSATISLLTWQNALTQTLPPAGTTTIYADWRLPNFKELGSIVEYACYNLSINENIFPNAYPGSYWASTPAGNSFFTNDAFTVNFASGEIFRFIRTGLSGVRLVRGGQ